MSEATKISFAISGAMAIGMLLGLLQGCNAGREELRIQAIKHGAAEYRCDPETGKTTFVWLTNKKGERE